MTAAVPILATKQCGSCRQVKPVSEFYRNRRARDGLGWECSQCNREKVARRKEIQRTELGDEEFLRRQREITARSRAKDNLTSLRYSRAQAAAMRVLISRHRQEWEHLMVLARRGELEMVTS